MGHHVRDADLAPLRGLTQLQTLNLWGSQLTDAGLEYVGRLKNLRKLDLSDNSITDAGLVHLQGLTQLETLELQGTQVTDAGAHNSSKPCRGSPLTALTWRKQLPRR